MPEASIISFELISKLFSSDFIHFLMMNCFFICSDEKQITHHFSVLKIRKRSSIQEFEKLA